MSTEHKMGISYANHLNNTTRQVDEVLGLEKNTVLADGTIVENGYIVAEGGEHAGRPILLDTKEIKISQTVLL